MSCIAVLDGQGEQYSLGTWETVTINSPLLSEVEHKLSKMGSLVLMAIAWSRIRASLIKHIPKNSPI